MNTPKTIAKNTASTTAYHITHLTQWDAGLVDEDVDTQRMSACGEVVEITRTRLKHGCTYTLNGESVGNINGLNRAYAELMAERSIR